MEFSLSIYFIYFVIAFSTWVKYRNSEKVAKRPIIASAEHTLQKHLRIQNAPRQHLLSDSQTNPAQLPLRFNSTDPSINVYVASSAFKALEYGNNIRGANVVLLVEIAYDENIPVKW